MYKNNSLLIIITLSVLLASAAVHELMGQASSTPVINQKAEHVLQSTINKTSYHLSISLPQHYSPKDTTHYPVLYILDGSLAFPIAHAARTSLDMFGDLDKMIIVGIEYEWK